MFFNASPRRGWNTHKMLEAAKAGAEDAGAETEFVNLYDITLFSDEEKRAQRDAHFATDIANGRALCKRLVKKAMTHI